MTSETQALTYGARLAVLECPMVHAATEGGVVLAPVPSWTLIATAAPPDEAAQSGLEALLEPGTLIAVAILSSIGTLLVANWQRRMANRDARMQGLSTVIVELESNIESCKDGNWIISLDKVAPQRTVVKTLRTSALHMHSAHLAALDPTALSAVLRAYEAVDTVNGAARARSLVEAGSEKWSDELVYREFCPLVEEALSRHEAAVAALREQMPPEQSRWTSLRARFSSREET